MAKFLISDYIVQVPNALMNEAIQKSMQGDRYEGHEAYAVTRHVIKGDRVLELGGGVGYIGMLIASRVGGENLMTVEANPLMTPVIEKNLTINLIEGVTVINAAVVPDSFPEDHATFHITPAFWASSLNPVMAKKWKTTKPVDVPAVKIGELLNEHKPSVVIMDIEGGEAGLFATPWPDHVRLLIIELHPHIYGDDVIKQIFDQMSASNLTYCPVGSRGQVVVFKRLGDQTKVET